MEVIYITLDRPHSVAMKMTRGPVFFERDIQGRLSGLKHAAEQTELLRDLREKRSSARTH